MAMTATTGGVWDETAAFCRREAGLLLPVAALGFALPLVVLLLAVPADQAASGRLVPGPWLLWMIPCGLFGMTGSLALSAMALRPGASVGESLRTALTRVPAGIGIYLLFVGAQLVLSTAMAALGLVAGRLGGVGTAAMLAAEVAVLALLIWLSVRLLPLWAMLADRAASPVAAVRAAFAATRGRYRTLLLVRLAGGVAGVVALFVTLIPIGAVCGLIGVATGQKGAATTLSYVLSGAAFAGVMTVWTVFVARLYRRIAPSIGI